MEDPKSLKDLQELWYTKIAEGENGFCDIESIKHKSRPLKEWHNLKFCSDRFQIIRANRSQYQRRIDDFMNHPSFIDACISVTSHANCKFTVEQAYLVWELHCQGMTRRCIAKRLGRVKVRIDDLIKRLTQWMQYI